MLEIIKVSHSYGGEKILQDLSLSINTPQIVGLVAPNGTGKTTLLKIISKSIRIQKGKLKINEVDSGNRREYLKQIFFIESGTSLIPDLTVLDHLKYVKKMWKSKVCIKEVLSRLNMDSYKNKTVKKLSLGMQQHLIIAMYMVSDASVILLDEPHNGLDLTSVVLIKKIFLELKNSGKIILYSSHDLFNMENFCDQVLYMKDESIYLSANSTENLIEIYNQLYNVEEGRELNGIN
jgi:ABC-type multidrug transport system, ATPase component